MKRFSFDLYKVLPYLAKRTMPARLRNGLFRSHGRSSRRRFEVASLTALLIVFLSSPGPSHCEGLMVGGDPPAQVDFAEEIEPVQGQGLMGGSGPPSPVEFISESEPARISQSPFAQVRAAHKHSGEGAPEKFSFHPMGGTFYGDLFTNNFVDLDPSSGVLDWDCTDFSYNGHDGSVCTTQNPQLFAAV